jgi:ankyrin repeat protein
MDHRDYHGHTATVTAIQKRGDDVVVDLMMASGPKNGRIVRSVNPIHIALLDLHVSSVNMESAGSESDPTQSDPARP